MHIYAIRHGEATYEPCKERGFIGHGLDLAPLTQNGIEQIRQSSQDSRLLEAEVILASPYNRALHSAAIISKAVNLDIKVEIDLHEWMPDTSFQFSSHREFRELLLDFDRNQGQHPAGTSLRWESIQHMQERVMGVLNRYVGKYHTIIVVCHGFVIRSLAFRRIVDNGQIVEIDYSPGMIPPKWEFPLVN
ncbi:MAG: histidine phosphatase family protein [Bacteroidota bacterium]